MHEPPMTMTKDQAQMLASLACAVRPHGATRWDEAGVIANIAKVKERSLADVVMAVMRAAADRKVASPGVIPTAGPHWNERLTEVTSPRPSRGPYCVHCGQAEDAAVHPSEHRFGRRPSSVSPDARTEARELLAAAGVRLPLSAPTTHPAADVAGEGGA